jgi:hypothetical protein
MRPYKVIAPIPPERFWSKVLQPDTDSCWPWIGARFANGYGRVRTSRSTTVTAHRLAFTLTYGQIPDGLVICHKCDNPPCCNPSHLFAGTHLDNVHDCIQKGRRARLEGEQHPMARLTEETARSVRVRYQSGEPSKVIASDVGVTPQMVWAIATGRSWRHL